MVSGYSADRNKNKFYGPLMPEYETKDTETAIEEAIKWIFREAK
jgi:hypothetical protein